MKDLLMHIMIYEYSKTLKYLELELEIPKRRHLCWHDVSHGCDITPIVQTWSSFPIPPGRWSWLNSPYLGKSALTRHKSVSAPSTRIWQSSAGGRTRPLSVNLLRWDVRAGRLLCRVLIKLGTVGLAKIIKLITDAAESATRWLWLKKEAPWLTAAGM